MIASSNEKMEVHLLFHVTMAYDGQFPLKMYAALGINVLGLNVPEVRFLIMKHPSE